MRFLVTTAVDDGGLDSGADGTGAGAESLNLLDDLHGLLISDLAEDDVLTIEPRGDNGGDEELGAVAVKKKREMFSYGSVDQTGYKTETYVLGPALAMDRRPGRVCLWMKFSSANFSP